MDNPPDDRVRFLHMRDAARDALKYVEGKTRTDLDTDSMLLRALVQCLQSIGEAAARTSEAARARAPGIPWPKIVGMRHILVHVYYDIDADTVWKVTNQNLQPLIADLEAALANWP